MSVIYWLLGLDAPGAIERTGEWSWYAAAPLAGVWLAVIALLALAVAGLNLLPQNVMPWRTRIGLTLLRLGGFALLLLMLLQMELRLRVVRQLPPNVAILTDTSGSMGLRDVAGGTRLKAAQALREKLTAELGARANLADYRCNWRLDPGPRAGEATAEGLTDLMGSLQELNRRETDLQAVILLTDGNDTAQNQGELTAPLLAERGVPVFPVVFGEATVPKLARVQIRGASDFLRLGDEMPLSAVITAENLPEQSVSVQLYEVGQTQPLVTRENVKIGKDRTQVSFVVRPQQAGLHTYRVVAEGVKGAVSEQLLVEEHQVEVIDSRIRVLYLDIPRDERKFLGHWLARDPVVDLATLTLLPKGGWYAQGQMRHTNAGDGLPNKEEDLYQYDVIIFGDIPRAYFREGGDVAETKMQWLAEFVARRGGGLITLGGRSVYAAGQYQGSALAAILPFSLDATDKPQVEGLFTATPTPLGLSHPIMRLESDDDRNREAWLDLPRLEGCNQVGQTKPGATLLAVRQEAGATLPLMALQNVGKGNVLALAADTTWRWEMQVAADSPDYYRRFWGNAVRSLAPDPRLQPGRPQVQRNRAAVPVGKRLTLSTRLVNKLFRPIRQADLEVSVTKPSGRTLKIYPQDGRGSPGLYEYDLDIDEAGRWNVATRYAEQTVTEEFTAGDKRDELQDPRARPELMASFATATGGKSFTPEQLPALLERLQLKPRQLTQNYCIAIWNRPLILVLMTLVVCLDCLIRKRRGMV